MRVTLSQMRCRCSSRSRPRDTQQKCAEGVSDAVASGNLRTDGVIHIWCEVTSLCRWGIGVVDEACQALAAPVLLLVAIPSQDRAGAAVLDMLTCPIICAVELR